MPTLRLQVIFEAKPCGSLTLSHLFLTVLCAHLNTLQVEQPPGYKYSYMRSFKFIADGVYVLVQLKQVAEPTPDKPNRMVWQLFADVNNRPIGLVAKPNAFHTITYTKSEYGVDGRVVIVAGAHPLFQWG